MNKFVKEAFKTGLLSPISLERGEFVLKGTEYIVIIRREHVLFQKKTIVSGKRAGRRSFSGVSQVPYVQYVTVSFEEVFESAPKHVREELIYHINVFNKPSADEVGFQIPISPSGIPSVAEISKDIKSKSDFLLKNGRWASVNVYLNFVADILDRKDSIVKTEYENYRWEFKYNSFSSNWPTYPRGYSQYLVSIDEKQMWSS
tara:strand:- start:185 stop:790 length:606 start_codon:yes stop_codon:yes gene_type:complete